MNLTLADLLPKGSPFPVALTPFMFREDIIYPHTEPLSFILILTPTDDPSVLADFVQIKAKSRSVWFKDWSGPLPVWHIQYKKDYVRYQCLKDFLPRLSLIILTGATGPYAVSLDPAVARKLRDMCQVAGVGFNFGGWGTSVPVEQFLLMPDENIEDKNGFLLPPEKWKNNYLDGVLHNDGLKEKP